jgi:hypothetical protein
MVHAPMRILLGRILNVVLIENAALYYVCNVWQYRNSIIIKFQALLARTRLALGIVRGLVTRIIVTRKILRLRARVVPVDTYSQS